MKKWSMILGAVVLAGGILGACSEKETTKQSTDKPAEEPAEEPEQDTQVEQEEEGTTEQPASETETETEQPADDAPEANKETTEGKDEANKQPAEQTQPAKAVEAKGIFNGVGDPHTVEIEVNGQPQSFQVAPGSEIMKKFDKMSEGTEITFTYKKEGEQLILQELKSEGAKQPETGTAVEAKGIFNGMADPHTVEIEVNGQPQSFQVAPESETMKKFDTLKEGTEIAFTYKKEGEQLILQELK
ncbi:hypothetical protein ACP2W0_09120 [Pseudobacillus badius]|uniref:hypothetical protein n=1 Tax=Bacillus badius TaxID=1455 RepID=UPI0007B088E4|nr:hypothetical protein [Bacillus badius]KZN99700.1 hypothetical protein A4244_17030 [Bacillus badius]MED0666487.1 hypothetical protein [Bacillus badius]OCS85805.1 hypothetical protein A6M11_17045 [Bacillus badius]OVE51837.1 hypothetical protein B1A98_09785 [Bacillus badius]TDW03264.1 hypothetical protein B0G66_104170 [Bacillus badius]